MSESKSEKLARLRAEKAAVAAAQTLTPEQLEDLEVAAAEQALADEQAWADAVKNHGRDNVSKCETEAGLVIVKKPAGAAFRSFSDQKESKTIDVEQLVFPCRVYPSAEKFGRWLDQKPGILADLLVAVCALAGSSAAARAKKSSR